jgi:hypothetical protein
MSHKDDIYLKKHSIISLLDAVQVCELYIKVCVNFHNYSEKHNTKKLQIK